MKEFREKIDTWATTEEEKAWRAESDAESVRARAAIKTMDEARSKGDSTAVIALLETAFPHAQASVPASRRFVRLEQTTHGRRSGQPSGQRDGPEHPANAVSGQAGASAADSLNEQAKRLVQAVAVFKLGPGFAALSNGGPRFVRAMRALLGDYARHTRVRAGVRYGCVIPVCSQVAVMTRSRRLAATRPTSTV